MKPQTATTIEQSQRLIACGVNPDSADMTWQTPIMTSQKSNKSLVVWRPKHKDYIGDVPAWSLSALLDMMKDKKVLVAYLPKEKEWQVLAKINNVNHGCYSDSPIESCVKMLELMYKNDYTLNTK